VSVPDATLTDVVVEARTARACLTPGVAEVLCAGHFPGSAVVPGAYLAGLMAELAVHLMPGRRLAEVVRCVFLAPVRPEPAITVTAEAVDEAHVDAEVRCRGACAARASLRFTR